MTVDRTETTAERHEKWTAIEMHIRALASLMLLKEIPTKVEEYLQVREYALALSELTAEIENG